MYKKYKELQRLLYRTITVQVLRKNIEFILCVKKITIKLYFIHLISYMIKKLLRTKKLIDFNAENVD